MFCKLYKFHDCADFTLLLKYKDHLQLLCIPKNIILSATTLLSRSLKAYPDMYKSQTLSQGLRSYYDILTEQISV